jgi:phosphoserine phosphatase
MTSQPQLNAWNDTATINRIRAFVEETTTEGHPMFVPEDERFATVDVDGTLMCEMPMALACELYGDLYVKQAAGNHPEYKDTDLYRICCAGDLTQLYSLPYAQIVEAFHTLLAKGAEGMERGEFEAFALDFFARRRSEKLQLPYSKLTYEPMLQLLDFMTSHGYKVYTCSGSPLAMLQAVCPSMLHIPRDRAIGSTVVEHWIVDEAGKGRFVVGNELANGGLNDKEAKPANILRAIGRAPVIAIGNSDGDMCMLDFAKSREEDGKPALAVLINHDDAEREFAYDMMAKKAKVAAPEKDWVMVSMKDDFRRVFSSHSACACVRG